MSVILETTKGDITVDLFIKERPKSKLSWKFHCLKAYIKHFFLASMNFLKLCKMKKYNFNRFHHVERNFLCQTGDPTGTGRGGESIFGYVLHEIVLYGFNHYQDFVSLLYGEQAKYYEAEQVPVIKHTKPGLLSMVNVGDNM